MPPSFVKAPRSIYLQRFAKFLSSTDYADINLFSRVYCPCASEPALSLFSVPDNARIPFDVAIKNKFEPCHVGIELGPSWSTHWFHIRVQIPKDCAGKAVVFVFNANCEGLIYTKAGSIVHGLTGAPHSNAVRRADYFLTNCAKGNEEFEFYIEAACNGLFGNGADGDISAPSDTKTFKLVEAHLRCINLDAEKLKIDFQILSGLAGNVDNDCFACSDQALATANDIMDVFYSTGCISRCLEISNAFFDKISKSPSTSQSIFAVGHCHIDTAWLWPYAETRRKIARSWFSQIELMHQFPGYKFACSQAQQFAWLEEDHPKDFKRLAEEVARGNFLPIGGTWVEFDGNIPSGEALVRQFFYGQRYFKSRFGRPSKVFWLPDTFGYTAQLPQIARLAGIKYFFTQKLSWNNFNKFPHTSFVWVALDGRSELLTHFCPSDTYCAQMQVKEVAMHVSNNKDLATTNASLMLFGHGDGGGGPTRDMLQRMQRLRALDGLPAVVPGDPDDFYQNLEACAPRLTRWHGELYFELHRGTYTSQARVKLGNRRCEFLLQDLELCASFLHSSLYPRSEIEELWKIVLLNQFHDVLPGTSIEMVYDDAHRMHDDVLARGKILLQNALASLHPKLDSGEAAKMCFFNTCSYSRVEIVEIPSSVWVESMPRQQLSANGSSVLAIINAKPFDFTIISPENVLLSSQNVKVTRCADSRTVIFENAYVSYVITDCGLIVEIFDKTNSVVLVSKTGAPANQYRLYSDVPLFWDAWDVEFYHENSSIDAIEYASWNEQKTSNTTSFEILEQGPIRAIARCRIRITETSWVEQDFELSACSPLLTVRALAHWDEKHKIMKVEFPVNITSDVASYEVPYGLVQRPTHRNTSWDAAKFEVCGHKFMDVSCKSHGVSLLSDCKYGYSCRTENGISHMTMSLLRAPKKPSATCDIGDHKFAYAIFPHGRSGVDYETVQAAMSFNRCLLRSFGASDQQSSSSAPTEGRNNDQDVVNLAVSRKNGGGGASSICAAFLDLNNSCCESVILDSVKRAEPDSEICKVFSDPLIVRLYESVGAHVSKLTLRVRHEHDGGVWGCREVDIMENEIVLENKSLVKSVVSEKEAHSKKVLGETLFLISLEPFQVLNLAFGVPANRQSPKSGGSQPIQ